MEPSIELKPNQEATGQIEPPPTETELKTHTKKTGLWLGIITLFLLVIAVAGYFYYQNQNLKKALTQIPPSNPSNPTIPVVQPTTTDLTANWQTYLNKQYGYSLQMPPSWRVESEEQSKAVSQLNPQQKISKATLTNGDLKIEIFYEGDWDHGFEPNVAVLSTTTLIGGKTAKLVVLKPKENDPPNGGLAWYSIPELPDFRIETTYDDEIAQILSTFKFLEPNANNPTPISKSTITSLTYSLPLGWVTTQDPDNAYEIGFNPELDEAKTYPDTDNRLFLVSTTGLKSMHSVFRVTEYDGGSRHAYLEKMMGEPLSGGDKLPDFREVEYIIQGKKCLIYDGYTISMSPQVWGMCPISSTKALFFNISRQNLLERLKTIKFLY